MNCCVAEAIPQAAVPPIEMPQVAVSAKTAESARIIRVEKA